MPRSTVLLPHQQQQADVVPACPSSSSLGTSPPSRTYSSRSEGPPFFPLSRTGSARSERPVGHRPAAREREHVLDRHLERACRLRASAPDALVERREQLLDLGHPLLVAPRSPQRRARITGRSSPGNWYWPAAPALELHETSCSASSTRVALCSGTRRSPATFTCRRPQECCSRVCGADVDRRDPQEIGASILRRDRDHVLQ